MGLIKEPLDIDFFVDPRPLTVAEQQMISDYISKERQQKEMTIKKTRKQKRQSSLIPE